ncbi:MAG: hypothetical protein KTR18_16190 [Acidiferrobacterales bacterium]|nr:hypothetical protein [Acidiferrobacterales bacterium]
MTSAIEPVFETAIAAADLARTITTRYFRQEIAITNKQDTTPVTIADSETEAAIKALIHKNHPTHGFFGEETGDQTADERWRWIVDPIDGTKSFATGNPTFGTLISVIHDDVPVIGIIDHPALQERWIGRAGEPTTLNGTVCCTSSEQQLNSATVYCTTIDMFTDASFQQFDRLSKHCRYRAFGGDCYNYGLLASGHTQLVCEADLKPYDFMALIPVIEGAGGIISDWNGEPLTPKSGDKVIAAANSGLHQQALSILQN